MLSLGIKSIWKRYFVKRFLESITFFLFSFWILYVLIDMMSHIKNILQSGSGFLIWSEYYIWTFLRRLDVLLPFAILIATIKTLCQFNSRNELVAMLASGVSLKKLLAPFVWIGVFFSLVLYLNYQFLYPFACTRINWIHDAYAKNQSNTISDTPLQEILLKDGSKIIYRNYDSTQKVFCDVFWIRSTDELYHMKTLSTDLEKPTGTYVDRIVRQANGKMDKDSSWENRVFKKFKYDESSLQYSLVAPKEQSLLSLWSQLPTTKPPYSEKKGVIVANFWYKLLNPWLCLLTIIAIAPFCVRFSRNFPILITYLSAIASLFCFNLILQASLTIAQSQSTSPVFVILLPWVILFPIFGKKYLSLL